MSGQDCSTRYPILLVHGTGFRDWKRLGYWGRIPELLRRRGAAVYFGHQDGWATVEENARYLARRVDEILAETGSEKLNLIAHSKGGLDARYLISSLGYGNRGMSHMDEVDFRRPLTGRDGPVDPAERYAALVEGLRERRL